MYRSKTTYFLITALDLQLRFRFLSPVNVCFVVGLYIVMKGVTSFSTCGFCVRLFREKRHKIDKSGVNLQKRLCKESVLSVIFMTVCLSLTCPVNAVLMRADMARVSSITGHLPGWIKGRLLLQLTFIRFKYLLEGNCAGNFKYNHIN